MADNPKPASEPLKAGAHAANAVRGAVKAGKAIAAAAKGAASGGPYGAIICFAWENRKLIFKILIASIVAILVPILILYMLPSVMFGGLSASHSTGDTNVIILNDSSIIQRNMDQITASLGSILADAKEDLWVEIDLDFSSSSADRKEIIDAHETLSEDELISFIAQYSAFRSKDLQSVSISDMAAILQQSKDALYSYSKTYEDRTSTVSEEAVDPDSGELILTSTQVTEKWAIYTITYNGEDYFAEHIFALSAQQKQLAEDYAENLKLFLANGL